MTNEENKGAEFRVGQQASAIGAGYDADEEEGRFFGVFLRFDANTGKAVIRDDKDGCETWCHRSSLRHEPAEQKARFYQRQPDVLPATLPAGTWYETSCGERYQARSVVQLQGGFHYYAKWRFDDLTWVSPERIDWTTVPIQEDSPPARASADLPIGEFRYGLTTEMSKHGAGVAVQGWVSGMHPTMLGVVVLEFRDSEETIATVTLESLSTTPHSASAPHCDKCMNPAVGGTLCAEHARTLGKPAEPGLADPYAAHREKLSQQLYGVSGADTRIAIMIAQENNDTRRLSAMTLRERRKSEALRMMDRPCEAKHPGHPRSWPEDSGEELRVS